MCVFVCGGFSIRPYRALDLNIFLNLRFLMNCLFPSGLGLTRSCQAVRSVQLLISPPTSPPFPPSLLVLVSNMGTRSHKLTFVLHDASKEPFHHLLPLPLICFSKLKFRHSSSSSSGSVTRFYKPVTSTITSMWSSSKICSEISVKGCDLPKNDIVTAPGQLK